MKVIFVLLLAIGIFGAAGYTTYRLFIQPEIALREEKAQPPPPPPPDPTVPEFMKSVALHKAGKIVQARDSLYAFIEQYPESSKGGEARDLIGEINTRIYLTPFPSPDKEIYNVKPGDVIDRVARHTKSSGELIMKANGLSGTMLRIGQKLSIPLLDLSVVINKKKNHVIIMNRNRFFKWYPVVAWPPALDKKPVPGRPVVAAPKLAGKVSEKMAWVNGQRVTYAEKTYAESTHWIQINIPHCTLHSIVDEKADGRPPGGGIVLAPKALEELAALLQKGDAVTYEP